MPMVGRSFSIWSQDGSLVFDSGNAFEHLIAKRSPDVFNANGGADEKDDRSDDKGPEPEALALEQLMVAPMLSSGWNAIMQFCL